MNTMIIFNFDASGSPRYICSESSFNPLSQIQRKLLHDSLMQAAVLIKKQSAVFYRTLLSKSRIQIRLFDDAHEPACLLSHEVLLNPALLDCKKETRIHRKRFLAGLLFRMLYHWCNPELHITQVRLFTLHFLRKQRDILTSTLDQMRSNAPAFDEPDWYESLCQIDALCMLDEFWVRLSSTHHIISIYGAAKSTKSRINQKIKNAILEGARQIQIEASEDTKLLTQFKWILAADDSLLLIYNLPDKLLKVIRLCPVGHIDSMSTDYACQSFIQKHVRTDIFHDHGYWIRDWIQSLQIQARDTSLKQLEQMLLSQDLHTVRLAVGQLIQKIRRKDNSDSAYRLLYSSLYYWNHPDKGMCRSVCLEVSAILEDILTERPSTFPPSQVNRSVFRSQPAVIEVEIRKPRTIRKDNFKARIVWSVNGRRKKPLIMTPAGRIRAGGIISFSATLPIKAGWAHYAVQFSTDNGATWHWEEMDSRSNGLIKLVPDERGQRVLSFYADTFNLQLDNHYRPIKDANGMFVYGTFDDIAAQLEDIRKEGYTRIYPLGALELGWAGEAGPDPSVFSVLDGRTVRKDLGGLKGLIRLRQKADSLGMKVLICVLSHFSRANSSFPYQLPVYIVNDQGKLTRRAGWDGEWSEWLDSFMVNMRDFKNVKYLTDISIELTRLGFGLRIDVGHGFDTVFPISPALKGISRLLGEVTNEGFEPVDLRKTDEPNIPLLYMCYKIQKADPNSVVVYSEQWHGNETRMLKSGTVPYNSLIKNLENIRSGQSVNEGLGLCDNLKYLNRIYKEHGGQTLSLFNSHDEESPASNYQNMIWPAAALLVLSSQGPLMYHISRLPGPETGTVQQRFDQAYIECWKHWVNNRFHHPWDEEVRAQWQIISNYPILYGFGKYLRRLFNFVDENPAFVYGQLVPIDTRNSRLAAFLRIYKNRSYLCLFNFPDSHTEGQAAASRLYNFSLDTKDEQFTVHTDEIYEIVERYNNTEGRTRHGRKEFWSGRELIQLGFSGIAEPVSSHVYEITEKNEPHARRQLMLDSFWRYSHYGKRERLNASYVAGAFLETTASSRGNYQHFSELFSLLASQIDRKNKLGVTTLLVLLNEISEENPQKRSMIINFLMRIAVNEKNRFKDAISHTAADILHGMNLGTIALVSPESQYSGHAGGVGIYTTDIADVLCELGFHVVVVTPLYEAYREKIIKSYAPHYDGHSFTVQFPEFDEMSQSISRNTSPDVVNILRANLLRQKHGKRVRVEVLYLENGKYLDIPYGGQTAEDKLRRARVLSQGALEALRAYNYYPTIIQTNEWPSWPLCSYLQRWPEFNSDPHFQNTHVISMMHNPHPSYSIKINEDNPFRRYYYCLILGMDAVVHADTCINPDSPSGYQIDLTYMMLKTSSHIGTVSRAMKQRILTEPEVFHYGHLYQQMEIEGRFLGRRNGFNMAARQRFWFSSQKSLLETHDSASQKRLFAKYTRAKKLAKKGLQNDPNIRLKPDDDKNQHVIFSMLHRISKQKGFELLLDWKVYEDGKHCWVVYEPWKMMGPTVLEHFLGTDERIQFVVCGRVEDSFDGRRFDMHFRRIASLPFCQGRFAYYPEGSLSTSLYRNVYVGSQFFVMPSGGEVGEPCGISQQEAHAGGTPVVAHHQDGLIRTVCDADFGDTESPPNGIKFSGFNGESLLTALLDAVEIYFKGQRLHYVDRKGKPRKCSYSDLSYNAFNTDHRWLRLLRDYIQAYCLMANVELPEHIDAVRFIAEASGTSDADLADLILKKGMKIPQAVDCLVASLSCPVASVRKASEKVLSRLSDIFQGQCYTIFQKRLEKAFEDVPENKNLKTFFDRLVTVKSKPQPTHKIKKRKRKQVELKS